MHFYIMPSSEAETISIRLLHVMKANATVLVDSKPATYLPPILCATCSKAELHGLLRPQGFTINELKEVVARSVELIWNLATVRQSAAQCRLCQLLLKCLEECRGFDTARTSDVFVQLEPIAEYQDMGKLTFWMIITGKRPRRTMEEFVRCQLKVGLRMRQDIEGLDRAIARKSLSCLGNCDLPAGSPQKGYLDGITQPSSSVPFPRDHPPRNRVDTGFISSNPSRPPLYPTCERELKHGPSSLWIHTVLEPAFNSISSTLDCFPEAFADPEDARSRFGPSSTKALYPFSDSPERSQGRVGSESASSGLVEQTSSLCIQLLGRRPKGPIDRQYASPTAGSLLNSSL